MDEATQKLIADAVEKATGGLVIKNKELLKDLKTQRETSKTFEGLDIEALKNASTELAKIKADKLENEGEYKKLYEQTKATGKEALDKALADNKALVGDLTKTKIVNELTNAVVKNSVIPELVDIAVNSLQSQVALTDAGVPMVGDKAVSDFVKDWAASDVGKHFITNGNTGGDANGNTGGVNANAKFFDKKDAAYSLTAQAVLANTDPKAFTALKEQYSK